MFVEFEMERLQSLYENEVKYNLSDSGNHPLSMNDLMSEEEIKRILEMEIYYGYTTGDPRLLSAIASWYPDKITSSNILVTNGSAEANFLIGWTLVEPDDEVIMVLPNYMQVPGLAKNLGAKVKTIHLKESLGWHLDLDELESIVNDKTKLISICNPSNPTGAVMTDEEMTSIAAIADKHGAYIHSDEVYRGSELDGNETKSFVHFYDKSIVSCGLSKSFAHPGLRIGWLVASPDVIQNIWTRKDYTTLCASVISQEIGTKIMTSPTRENILGRSSKMLTENLVLFQNWLDTHNGLFTFVPPKAGGMAFVGYNMDVNSTEFVHKLRVEQSVLIVPGDCYGMDGYLRFGIGANPDYLSEGLQLVSTCIKSLGY
tara:strand:+ start:987 stop:2102 length:1116 start_codon:yes stop_codon:yes gene_type:complete